MRTRAALLSFVLLAFVAGCTREAGHFSEPNARSHVQMLAGTIGSRPVGSDANARARAYIVDQLRLYGFQVRVQQADARRPDLGRTARVSNIIGVLPGPRREAVALVSHYDSRADTPGAGDDAFGVAVSLEAARVMAARDDRQWTTFVLVTDGEEDGLMGAAALVHDPQVRDTLAAYINLEGNGSAGPAMLFQTGPGNDWLVKAWSKVAPHPRGGSFAIEVYRRLPNDTDFTILARHDVPGLNFALVGDSHAYHTDRDTPERLSGRALRETGANVVGILSTLQRTDITQRTAVDPTYFDIGGTSALSYRPFWSWVLSILAVALGALAWMRVTRFLVRSEGMGRWLLGFAWTWLGFAVAVGAMIAATMALRAAREVYHPWHAHPGRLLLFLAVVGSAAGWAMARAGRWIPSRARGLRHPAVAWTAALPAWLLLGVLVSWFAPSAAYLWILPLFAAGLVLVVVPLTPDAFARAGSVVVLAVAATLWLRDTVELFHYTVAVFGRMPIVTPSFAYTPLVAMAGLMIAPPLLAAIATPRPLVRPALETGLLLAAIAATGMNAWLAPAYTREQPLRGTLRVLQEAGASESIWQVGSIEPGFDFGRGAPGGWTTAVPEARSIPWGTLGLPFTFSTPAPSLGEAPATIGAFSATNTAEGALVLRASVFPRQPALTITFMLPPGLVPLRANLPGLVRRGRWMATYIAPPEEGIAFEARFASGSPEQLHGLRVTVTMPGTPGGAGWQRLPEWLPTERWAWTAWSTWVLAPERRLEPVPPLR